MALNFKLIPTSLNELTILQNYSDLPKRLWFLWYQGWNIAPDIAKRCLNSWRFHNPTWTIVTLDKYNLDEYIDLSFLEEGSSNGITPASISDIVRIMLLRQYGGIWIDSTLFCNRKLESWLPPYMNEPFFAFSNPGPERLLASWFLASTNRSYIVDRWESAVLRYVDTCPKLGHDTPTLSMTAWQQGQLSGHYFWFHYLFSDLYTCDARFKAAWDRVRKYSADGPHLLQVSGLLGYPIPSEIKHIIARREIPLFKLTHRYSEAELKKNSTLDFLLHGVY